MVVGVQIRSDQVPDSGGRAQHCLVAGPALSPAPSWQQDRLHHPHCPVHSRSFLKSWQRVSSLGQGAPVLARHASTPWLPPAPSTPTPLVGPRERAASTGLLSPPPGPAPTASGSLGLCQVSSPLALSPECSPTPQAPYLAVFPSPLWPLALLFPPGALFLALSVRFCGLVVCACASVCVRCSWLCRSPSLAVCLTGWLDTGLAGGGVGETINLW